MQTCQITLTKSGTSPFVIKFLYGISARVHDRYRELLWKAQDQFLWKYGWITLIVQSWGDISIKYEQINGPRMFLGMPTIQRMKPNYVGSTLDLKEQFVPTSMDLNCKEQ